MKKTRKIPEKNGVQKVKKSPKAKVSKERIMEAAKKVFAGRPFSSASLRMIAREGGFEHPLIHYYFSTKAELFEAVLAQVCMELYEANINWFSGLDGTDPLNQMPVYLGRIMDYYREHPESFKILFLNMASLETEGHLPGLALIPQVILSTRETCQGKMAFLGSDEEHALLNNIFCNMLICYLGADECQAMVLGMTAATREYEEWVKNALMNLFMPWVEQMMRDDSRDQVVNQ